MPDDVEDRVDDAEKWADCVWALLVKDPQLRSKAIDFSNAIEAIAASKGIERLAVAVGALIVAHNSCASMHASAGGVAELSDYVTDWWMRVQIELDKHRELLGPVTHVGPN